MPRAPQGGVADSLSSCFWPSWAGVEAGGRHWGRQECPSCLGPVLLGVQRELWRFFSKTPIPLPSTLVSPIGRAVCCPHHMGSGGCSGGFTRGSGPSPRPDGMRPPPPTDSQKLRAGTGRSAAQVQDKEAETEVEGWGGEKLAHIPIVQLTPGADTTASEVEVWALEPGSPAMCFGQVTQPLCASVSPSVQWGGRCREGRCPHRAAAGLQRPTHDALGTAAAAFSFRCCPVCTCGEQRTHQGIGPHVGRPPRVPGCRSRAALGEVRGPGVW